MNAQQNKVAKRLKKALDECHEAGLMGGIFDCKFCVWPIDAPDPRETATAGQAGLARRPASSARRQFVDRQEAGGVLRLDVRSARYVAGGFAR